MYFIGEEEVEALRKLFEKKKFYRYRHGEKSECDLFESEFSNYVSSPYSLLLSSGTNALAVSLLAGGLKPGDEVLIPAYTFVATAAAVIHAGGIPVIVNIDKNLSMDFEDAVKKLSSRTKALILVHMDGLAANVLGAQSFCRQNELLFIEDVAQAIGGQAENKKLGTFGRFGCFSLNENKNISCGEGGILITKDRADYERAFCLHDGPAQFNPTKKDFFTQITPFMGLSMRVSEIQGTIMRVQLKRLDFILSELKKRKALLAAAVTGFKTVEYVAGYSAGECNSSLHLQFFDLEVAVNTSKKLREIGLAIAPVTTRPAHASWKWSHLLGGSYPASDYLQSVEILTRTYKSDINIHLSMSETEGLAAKIKKVLAGG